MRQIKELHDTFKGLNWETIFGRYTMTGDGFYLELEDFMENVSDIIDGSILMPGQSL